MNGSIVTTLVLEHIRDAMQVIAPGMTFKTGPTVKFYDDGGPCLAESFYQSSLLVDHTPDTVTAFLVANLDDERVFREHVFRLDDGDAELPSMAFRVDAYSDPGKITRQLCIAIDNFRPQLEEWIGGPLMEACDAR